LALVDQLTSLFEPVIADLGYELYAIDCRPHATNGLLRVYIESEAGIVVDDCAKVSREVSALLDVHDMLPGHYNLEVSSPGLDRPLFGVAHFERFTGQIAAISVFSPVDGRRKFKARIQRVENDVIHVEQDAQAYELHSDNIAKAKLVPEW